MNLVLLPASSQIGTQLTVTDPRRLKHLKEVHKAAPGQSLSVGLENGAMGRARLDALDDESAIFTIEHLDTPIPAPLPVHVVLALPRPRMLARSLENMAALGVKQITLLHTRRVEKSYWQSPELALDKLTHHLILGLEQCKDTRLPTVTLEKRFKPFVEDRLPGLLESAQGLFAHPGETHACPHGRALDAPPVVLAIGPEGGFIDYEVEAFRASGMQGIHLGSRILRVETAVVSLLSRLF